MNELYWITRFDPINTCATVFLILGSIASFISIALWIAGHVEEDSEEIAVGKKFSKTFIPVLVVSMFIKVFVPTTQEALLIYGVGGTIDYLQDNPTAQKLPDKCIQALDRWVDSWYIEEEDSVEK